MSVGCASSVHSAEIKRLPSLESSSADIDKFVSFYKQELATIKASLSVSNNTNQPLNVGTIHLEQGQSVTTPVELSPELQLTLGNVFQITSNSGTRLGTLGINIRSRGYFITRYPDAYKDPNKVFETADVTLLLGRKQAPRFVSKEFNIYALDKALLNISVNLKGDALEDSSIGVNID